MLQKEINKLLTTTDGSCDKRIAFSSKDVATMLNLPLSTVAKYLRQGKIKTYKIGIHYRILRKDLYRHLVDA